MCYQKEMIGKTPKKLSQRGRWIVKMRGKNSKLRGRGDFQVFQLVLNGLSHQKK